MITVIATHGPDGATMYAPERGTDRSFNRQAHVYPNAHNGGATYGVRIHEFTNGAHGKEWRDRWLGGKFCGANWDRHAAHDAALAWVRDGVLPDT